MAVVVMVASGGGAEAEAVANLGVGPQAGLFSRVHLGWADDPSLGWAG